MSDVVLPSPLHLSELLDGLAGNPMLPPELIRRLFAFRKGQCEVAKRADLTNGMIAEIIAIDSHWLTHSLALNRRLPPAFRMQLAEHRDPAVRKAVAIAAGDDAPDELFERLLGDAQQSVREQLAENDHVPTDLRARLAADPAPKVRAALAQWWPQAPESTRRLLLTDADGTVRAAACATYYRRLPHPVPPADLVPALLADPVTRAGAVRHCELDESLARRLAADQDDEVRQALAEHPGLPPQLRDVLAEDRSPLVRVRIFVRQDTPESTRAAIHGQIMDGASMQDMLSTDPDLDDESLELQIWNVAARMELGALRLPWVTADPLPYVDSPFACFRASAAMSEDLPEPVVARLLDDAASNVRTTMALHARARIDPATAERIDRTYRPDKRVRWRPADDLPLPVPVLRRLATDPDARMRQLAPRDPDLPEQLASRLAADPDHAVRHAIADHPRLPTRDLVALLADPVGSVAAAAAGSPNLPVAQMRRLLDLAEL